MLRKEKKNIYANCKPCKTSKVWKHVKSMEILSSVLSLQKNCVYSHNKYKENIAPRSEPSQGNFHMGEIGQESWILWYPKSKFFGNQTSDFMLIIFNQMKSKLTKMKNDFIKFCNFDYLTSTYFQHNRCWNRWGILLGS